MQRRITLARSLAVILAVVIAFSAGLAQAAVGPDAATREPDQSRRLSLYNIHTKEELTVTYSRNGRYVPEAMRRLNWFLRDWRRQEVIAIDPVVIDLMWELHADLGSRRPVHIISGYRSVHTNEALRNAGRNVARHSRHTTGQAIDLYFPDVPVERLRNSALARAIGGVGYYPYSAAQAGFVHIDTGRVRHWPTIGATRLARLMDDGRRTIGARHNKQIPSRQASRQLAALVVETAPAPPPPMPLRAPRATAKPLESLAPVRDKRLAMAWPPSTLAILPAIAPMSAGDRIVAGRPGVTRADRRRYDRRQHSVLAGKTDRLAVNRTGKGDFQSLRPTLLASR